MTTAEIIAAIREIEDVEELHTILAVTDELIDELTDEDEDSE